MFQPAVEGAVCAAREKSTVIPIEKGRALKTQRERQINELPQAPAVRRLIQCVELLAEVSRDIARKARGDQS